jgi:hypothetical protein
MTTIAWDGKNVAADRQMSSSTGYIYPGSREKLVSDSDSGRTYAHTGHAALFDPLIAWHKAGSDPKDVPVGAASDDTDILIVFEGGKCFGYRMSVPYPIEFFAPEAWGSGDLIAIGAMEAGATAQKAVEIATRRDAMTGCGILVENIEMRVIPTDA